MTGRGGDPQARFVQMTDELLRQRFVAEGVLTHAEFDELTLAFDDRSFWFVGFTLFGAWGRRPGSQPEQDPLMKLAGNEIGVR
jgi:hypothetical protein